MGEGHRRRPHHGRVAVALLLAGATLAAAAQEITLDELIARARKRDAEAEYMLGMRAYAGYGVPRSPDQALRLMQRAAQHGYVEAQNTYGYFLQHGIGTEADPARALPWYEAAANRGHAHAQVNLGWLYEHGQGVERSSATALEWYRKAAAQGVAEAELNAGHLLEAASPPDDAAAAAAYARAARQGLALGYDRLARLIEANRASSTEYGSALGNYLSAAQAGIADAQQAVARLELAAGGADNAREAAQWLERAAKQNNVGARAMLADARIQYRIAGELTSKPPAGEAEALPWLQRAAGQGLRDAQLRLGIAFEEGRGTARDAAAAAT